MSVGRICMNCMQGMKDENGVCTTCGAVENDIKTSNRHLAFRTIIKGKYLIGKVIGEGGFGITYLGYDLDLNVRVAIKEYCPRDYAGRDITDKVSILPFDEETAEFYDAEMTKFIGEAQRLAKFRGQKGIVSVLDYFKENGTTYIVMDYIEGITLRQYLKMLNKPLPFNEVLDMMLPIIHILEKVHEEGLIHRDISPDNIMLAVGKNEIYLIDFGTARSTNFADERSLSVYKKSSYTPIEQQSRHGKQGSWTDVYALCATIYYCITGRLIPESLDRIVKDEIIPPHELGVEILPQIENVLLRGLEVKIEDRIQTMKELRNGLFVVPESPQSYQYTLPKENETEETIVSRPKKKKKVIPIVLVLVIASSIIGGFGLNRAREREEYNRTHVFSDTNLVMGATTVMDLYTLEGEIVSSTYYSKDGEIVQTITYSFDDNNLLKEATDAEGNLISKEEYIYDSVDNVLEENIYNADGVLTKQQILKVDKSHLYQKGEAVGEVIGTIVFDEHGEILAKEDFIQGLQITYIYSSVGKEIITFNTRENYISKKELYDSKGVLLEEITYSVQGVSSIKKCNAKGICIKQEEYDATGTTVISQKTFDDDGNPLEDIQYDENGEERSKLIYVYLEDGTSAVVNYDYSGKKVATNVEGNREGFINLLRKEVSEMITEQCELAGRKPLEFNEVLMELAQKKAMESIPLNDCADMTRVDGEYYRERTEYDGCLYGDDTSRDVLELVDGVKFWIELDLEHGEGMANKKYTGAGIGIEQFENGIWACYLIFCYK